MFRAGLLLVIGRIFKRYVDWLQQPVNISFDYTSCCLYRFDPREYEQQACSKHVEV